MLKVKKQIQKKKSRDNNENEQLRNDIKNSIKNLFISNQTKKKTIDECAQLTTQIREEYAKLQKESNNLQIELEKYKKYVEQIQPGNRNKYCEKPIRKRKYYKRDYEQVDSDDDDDRDMYITEIRKRKKRLKKCIIYEDEIDGISEPDTEPEEEQEQEKEVKTDINKNKKPKKIKKGITKSIKT